MGWGGLSPLPSQVPREGPSAGNCLSPGWYCPLVATPMKLGQPQVSSRPWGYSVSSRAQEKVGPRRGPGSGSWKKRLVRPWAGGAHCPLCVIHKPAGSPSAGLSRAARTSRVPAAPRGQQSCTLVLGPGLGHELSPKFTQEGVMEEHQGMCRRTDGLVEGQTDGQTDGQMKR